MVRGVRRWPRSDSKDFAYCIAESRTSLWIEDSLAERKLQRGKVQNLRCAVRRLNGLVIPAGGLFSFWKQIGRATRRRGYVPGRQLREGCLFPAIGGGLCQLSNALYDLALQADCEIVERYPHSYVVPGSAAEQGRDATVTWNYMDLRFRPSQPLRIEARLTSNELIVRFCGESSSVSPTSDSAGPRPESASLPEMRPVLDVAAHRCATCGMETCFRHGSRLVQGLIAASAQDRSAEPTAFLMDECWPEFRQYLAASHSTRDILGIPLDGTRWKQPRYGWDTAGYSHIGTAAGPTLLRAFTTRRLGSYGAARLQAQLESAEALAQRLARELSADTLYVCAAQSLLPFLWHDGHLGGRRFEVVMTRLPLHVLHARLERALHLHPDRTTLGEFRAPPWIAEAEAEALAAAERVITPHADIAALFPGRAHRLDWLLPPARPVTPGPALAFPGPTAARKGAYELRAVARALDLEVVLPGNELEGEDFWEGVRVRRVRAGASQEWLHGVAAVIQPALIEERPRSLLAALAAGIPVIATPACGLGERAGVITIPAEEEAALRAAICRVFADGPVRL